MAHKSNGFARPNINSYLCKELRLMFVIYQFLQEYIANCQFAAFEPLNSRMEIPCTE